MSLTPTPNFSQMQSTARDFWDRKEGGLARWVLIATALVLAGVGVFFWGLILPFLIGVVGNTIQLALLCGVVAVLASPIYSSHVRGFLSNAFQMSMYWSYKKLIGKDPIALLKTNILSITKEGEQFDVSVGELSGTKQRIEDDIQVQMDEINKNAALWLAGKKMIATKQARLDKLTGNDLLEAKLSLQELELNQQNYLDVAGTAKQTVKMEKPTLDQLNSAYEKMCTLRSLAQFKVKSLTIKADQLSKRHDGMLAAQKSLGAAARILKGDPQQQANIEMAYEMLNNEAADTLGALKDFNRFSEKYVTDMDVQNTANNADAEKMFSQLEEKLALPGSTTPASAVLPIGTGSATPTISVGEVNTDDDFIKMLK